MIIIDNNIKLHLYIKVKKYIMDRRHIVKQSVKYYSNIIISSIIDELEVEIRKRQKRIWTKKWLLRRDTHGNSVGLLRELAVEDQMEYKRFMRITPVQFDFLLKKYKTPNTT